MEKDAGDCDHGAAVSCRGGGFQNVKAPLVVRGAKGIVPFKTKGVNGVVSVTFGFQAKTRSPF